MNSTDPNQGVPCMLMRGGSSKGAYLLAADLPTTPEQRDRLLLAMMGSPDARQIDGIGGAHPLTSKVAVISRSEDDADIDYLFLQVGVDTDTVSDRQNCGNLLAGVGQFAVERGLVAVDPHADSATVRIKMLNTDSIATARFPTLHGMPVYEGTTSISGVPGTAAEVQIEFDNIVGSTTGALLPTGHSVDTIDGVDCTLIDYGMPVVIVTATSLGVSGYETCAELEANDELRRRLESIRLQAGELMGLGDVSATTVPKMTLVAAPRDGGTVCTRTFIPHRCHDAIGVLGAVSVAAGVRLADTPGSSCANRIDGGHAESDPGGDDRIRVEHPTGFFDVVGPAAIVRTARKLMDGVVFPRHLSDEVPTVTTTPPNQKEA